MKNGGAAFPSPGVVFSNDGQQGAYEGMTLRDYFAGQALIGMLASEREDDDMKIIEYAEDSYRYADAMLKARDA